MTTPAFLDASQRRKTSGKAKKEVGAQSAAPADRDDASGSQSVRKADSPNGNSAKARRATQGEIKARRRGQQSASDPARGTALAALRALATRPEMIDLAEMVRPGSASGAFAALVDGASTRGPAGSADRAQLWRIFGMPWVPEVGNARTAGTLLGSALGAAVAQLEQGRRHDAVTVAPVIEAKPLEMQPYEGGGHVFAQHEDGQEGQAGRQQAGKAGDAEGQGDAAQAAPPRRSR